MKKKDCYYYINCESFHEGEFDCKDCKAYTKGGQEFLGIKTTQQ